MKLITEMSYDFEISEGKKDGDMFAVGIFSSAELKNNNKRMYKKSILEREVGKVQEKVEKKCLWGELGHPPNPEVNPDKIALRTTQLEWRGNDLYGKAKILDTPMGQIAKTLVKEGQMGISSRGLGTVAEDGYVNEDFHLITWDLVTDPSNNPSWVNGIYEGTEFAPITGVHNLNNKPTESDIKEAQAKYFNALIRAIDGDIDRVVLEKSAKYLDIWQGDHKSTLAYYEGQPASAWAMGNIPHNAPLTFSRKEVTRIINLLKMKNSPLVKE
jgi:hypothetical protein